ncbi:MAG: HipA N-terminal domain-containing protein [Tessaracoccus sp.]|nr:HipA N-terminal domain-containing protein [Tessaracoccus sp.]
MSAKELAVLLYGRQAGILEETRGGQHILTYSDDPGSTPVSLSMPLTLRQHKNRVVQPYLDGLLPDRVETREALGREFGVSGRNPFAILSHIGLDCGCRPVRRARPRRRDHRSAASPRRSSLARGPGRWRRHPGSARTR